MTTRITKSKTDRVIDGVCGGLADYFGIDSLLVRVAFVALMFINVIGLILYIVLLIIIPKAEKLDQPPKETIHENVQEMGERIKKQVKNWARYFQIRLKKNILIMLDGSVLSLF